MPVQSLVPWDLTINQMLAIIQIIFSTFFDTLYFATMRTISPELSFSRIWRSTRAWFQLYFKHCAILFDQTQPISTNIVSNHIQKRATPQGKTNRIFCHAVEYTAVVVGNDRCIIFYQGLMFIPNCGSLPASEVLNLRRPRHIIKRGAPF